jgi:hypothetical protein
LISILEKPFASMVWNEELQAVELTWMDHVASEDYRQSLELLLNTLSQRKSVRILIDSIKLKVILPEDQAWTNDVFVSKATALGLKKLASVMPESAVAKMSVARLVRKAKEAEGGLAYELVFFDTIEKARAWLKE